MKKIILLSGLILLGFFSVYSQMAYPETNDLVLLTKDLDALKSKVSLLQTIVLVSFSINLILSLAIIYTLQKKANTK